jgi:lysophospholipase L1-like esterase
VDETPWILKETADAGMDYIDELTFLGDSTTAHLINRGGLSGGKNTTQVWRGAVGNTITFAYVETVKIIYPKTGEKMLIVDAVKRDKPKYLVITLGVTGGVSMNLTEENFKKIYSWLLEEIAAASPQTTVIVQSIYPVNKVSDYKSITNEKIVKFNGWICDLAEQFYKAGRPVYYAHTYPALLDEEGYLPEKYGVGDGLHISEEGYKVILHYLRTHAVTLQKDQ